MHTVDMAIARQPGTQHSDPLPPPSESKEKKNWKAERKKKKGNTNQNNQDIHRRTLPNPPPYRPDNQGQTGTERTLKIAPLVISALAKAAIDMYQ